MNESNTKGVGNLLKKHNLKYLPEAHTYIKIKGETLDITRNTISGASFKNSLLTEIKMLPKDIGEFKIEYHQNYIKKWLLEKNIQYKFEAIWHIRELCIAALSA